MEGGKGNDTVVSQYGSDNVIDGGLGNDRISVIASEQNSYLASSGQNMIIGGQGDDTIYGALLMLTKMATAMTLSTITKMQI